MKTLKLSVSRYIIGIALTAVSLQMAGCGDEDQSTEVKDIQSVQLQAADFDVKSLKGIGHLIMPGFDMDNGTAFNVDLALNSEDLEIQLSEASGDTIVHEGEGFSGSTKILEQSDTKVHVKGSIQESVVPNSIAASTKYSVGSLTRSFEGIWESAMLVAKEQVVGNATDIDGRVYDVNTSWEFENPSAEEPLQQAARDRLEALYAQLRADKPQLSDAEFHQRLADIANSADFNLVMSGVRAGGTIVVDGTSYSYKKLVKVLMVSLSYAFSNMDN